MIKTTTPVGVCSGVGVRVATAVGMDVGIAVAAVVGVDVGVRVKEGVGMRVAVRGADYVGRTVGVEVCLDAAEGGDRSGDEESDGTTSTQIFARKP